MVGKEVGWWLGLLVSFFLVGNDVVGCFEGEDVGKNVGLLVVGELVGCVDGCIEGLMKG